MNVYGVVNIYAHDFGQLNKKFKIKFSAIFFEFANLYNLFFLTANQYKYKHICAIAISKMIVFFDSIHRLKKSTSLDTLECCTLIHQLTVVEIVSLSFSL